MTRPFHMIQAQFYAAGLARLGRERRLPLQNADAGYLLHVALQEVFSGQGPRPFSLESSRGSLVTVLGYSDHPARFLQRRSQELASPALYALCNWRSFASKPMPAQWPTGRILSFRVRTCPVIRKSSEGEKHSKGSEVDVFLDACWKAESPDIAIDRERVYNAWLNAEFCRRGGARLIRARLSSFRRTRLVRRRTTDRGSRRCERPDAVLDGSLEVTDSAAFQATLRRGIGRHRGFGFGMLLLRPAK